jgi:hypothetical protein
MDRAAGTPWSMVAAGLVRGGPPRTRDRMEATRGLAAAAAGNAPSPERSRKRTGTALQAGGGGLIKWRFLQRVLKFFPKAQRGSAGLPSLCLAAGVAALATAAPAQALTWNFSVSLDNGETATGTFETAGTTPVLGQIYTITSISGSQNGVAITGFDPIQGATFQWNGSPSSIVTDNIGDYYKIGNVNWNLFFGAEAYGAVDNWVNEVTLGSISSSSLSPASPAGVPGPLPLFGAAAAFGWSRRLRRRVQPAR